MLSKLRARLSYANVTATLALFIAMTGGIAFAISNNSVSSRHIVDGRVKTPDLRDGAVTGAKLSNGALKSKVTLADLPDGTPGCTLEVGDSWVNYDPDVNERAGWRVEPSGIVYLQGVVRRCNGASTTAFTLPVGVRPAKLTHIPSVDEQLNNQDIQVRPDGTVTLPDADTALTIYLNGGGFRCAGGSCG